MLVLRPSSLRRSAIFGTVLLSGILVGSCETLSGLSKPSAKVIGTRLDGLDLQGIDLIFDVDVSNPYTVPLPVAKIDYALASGGQKFLSGASDVQGSIPASGKKTLPLKARVNFSEAMSLLSGIRPGKVIPYAADLGVSVDAPAVGNLRLPVQHQGQFPIPAIPRISVKDISWQNLSLQSASALMRLDVANDNEFPLDLRQLAYGLDLGGQRVVNSSVEKALSFAPGQTQAMDLAFSLKPQDLGLGALQMLSGSSAPYALSGTLQTETPFGPLSFPIGDRGQTALKK